ncbi:hypothetical protein CHLRE_12g547734v5 [Chlamydomonas reinhardtii]|uniref:Uncharacterized protein n=1 Tax=Chlamydomonas reinhardtii TaxID=3055 RepID=A0A2K3D6E4_CHLRE|nr:uncharacterized protein CHLRE_12g547734v5 [Chlamydomonas reinhardtii]PNW76102.1 hypothetical protein CHLRE_12g547734v5 [Chlamydomonas reinhardtii]
MLYSQASTLLLLAAFVVGPTTLVCSEGHGEPGVLRANTHLEAQVASLDGTPLLFSFAGLKPLTSYEVRVSYPATTPAIIHLRLAAGELHRGQSRRLLDTEKLIFSTDASGNAQGIPDALVELRATGRFVHRDGPGAGPKRLVFNIVCQELLLGAVPTDTLPAIFACVLLVVAGWSCAPYFSGRVVPRLLSWVLEGR